MSKLPTIPPVDRVLPPPLKLNVAATCAEPNSPACLARQVIEWDSATRRLRRGQ